MKATTLLLLCAVSVMFAQKRNPPGRIPELLTGKGPCSPSGSPCSLVGPPCCLGTCPGRFGRCPIPKDITDRIKNSLPKFKDAASIVSSEIKKLASGDSSEDLCPTRITDGIKKLLPKIKEAVSVVSEIKKLVGDIPEFGPEVEKLLIPMLDFLDLVENGLTDVQNFCNKTKRDIRVSICPDKITKFISEALLGAKDVTKTIEEIEKIANDIPVIGKEVDSLLDEITGAVQLSQEVLNALKEFCDFLDVNQDSSDYDYVVGFGAFSSSEDFCPVDRRCRNKQGECHPILCPTGFMKVGICETGNNCVCCVPSKGK